MRKRNEKLPFTSGFFHDLECLQDEGNAALPCSREGDLAPARNKAGKIPAR
jgi:hypothetical protein